MKGSYFFVIVMFSNLLLLTSCIFEKTPYPSCSLSTPKVSGNYIQVPYEIVVHRDYSDPKDSLDVSFSVIIKVKNKDNNSIITYSSKVSAELYEHDKNPYTGYAEFSIASNESFIIDSAEITDIDYYYRYAFICQNHQVLNLASSNKCNAESLP